MGPWSWADPDFDSYLADRLDSSLRPALLIGRPLFRPDVRISPARPWVPTQLDIDGHLLDLLRQCHRRDGWILSIQRSPLSIPGGKVNIV